MESELDRVTRRGMWNGRVIEAAWRLLFLRVIILRFVLGLFLTVSFIVRGRAVQAAVAAIRRRVWMIFIGRSPLVIVRRRHDCRDRRRGQGFAAESQVVWCRERRKDLQKPTRSNAL